MPIMAVLPSKNDCITGQAWGTATISNEVTAPNTTPTTTPESNKRKLWCAPRANNKVSSTAPHAPAKAQPVNPKRHTQGWAQATLGESTAPPQDTAAKAAATPRPAPDALPNK
jgi:hypothetical protein